MDWLRHHMTAGRFRWTRGTLALVLAGFVAAVAAAAHPEESLFQTPAQEHGVRCWWWWLNGNVTAESITSDLEAMKARGFSGAAIIDAGGADNRGNGPVPAGPLFGSADWRKLFLHALVEARRLHLELSLMIQSGWNVGGPDVTVEESNKHLTWSESVVRGPGTIREKLPLPPAKEGFYRDIAVIAVPAGKPDAAPIRQLRVKASFAEAGSSAPDTRHLLTDIPATPGEEDAAVGDVRIVTESVGADGAIAWEVPPGEWRLLRFGYTTSGARLKTSSGQWQGLMIDFMSKRRFDHYWDQNIEPLLEVAGDHVGTTLRYVQTDSWEGGGLNWTEDFREQFRQRRGYDLLPFLPVVAGRIIGSRDVSNRFLADLRKTIGECIAENHYGRFAERARRRGLGIMPESAGPHAGPFDGLKNYRHSEIMMGEFWSPSAHRPQPAQRFFVKQAASAAHVYGRRLVGAEAFTTVGKHWDDVLWADMKSSFDHEVCAGLNLVFLHTFTSSPAAMGQPGQEYFAGTHVNPNVTWWHLSAPFFQYLARSQYMMQEGRFVADVLYYYGDHVPNIARGKQDDPARILPGYDYDVIDENSLLTLRMQDGALTLPQGGRYRVLVLPDHKILSLAALRKTRELVMAGAAVVGPKPESTCSLVGYPESETELRAIATELWGDGTAAARRVGRGHVVAGQDARDVLRADGVTPDFVAQGMASGAAIDYIHHSTPTAEFYFVSNQQKESASIEASFRQSGRQPELWDPVSGEIRPAAAFRQERGRTVVPLEFGPYGSTFVVFRNPIPSNRSGTAPANFPRLQPLTELGGPWELAFDPRWGGPARTQFDHLQSWSTHPDDGIRHFSGSVVYRKQFAVPTVPDGRVYLDLGDVQDVGIARVRLNGTDRGVLWTPPFRVDVTNVLRPGENALEVEVVNSWRNRLVGDRDKPEHVRLTRTNVKVLPDWRLLPAGLLGPVRLLRAVDAEDGAR